MSVTVKAYFEKGAGQDTDIRRFLVPADVASSYEYLLRKVCDIFQGLTNEKVALYWRDDENDLIHFSSDDELMAALSFRENDIFKVYVRVQESSAGMPDANVPHPGVTCDGCEKPIFGMRFKCCVCPDYDLCSTCMDSAVHNEHEMMKIPSPRHGPFGVNMPPPPQFRRWMNRYMRRWNKKNGAGEGTGPDVEEQAGNEQEAQDNTANEQSGADGQNDTNVGEDFLRNVGENVAAMLDPLGIDVHVDVETPGQDHCAFKGRGRGGRHGGCGRGHGPPWGKWWGHPGAWWGGHPHAFRMHGNGQATGGPNMEQGPSNPGQFDASMNGPWGKWMAEQCQGMKKDGCKGMGKNKAKTAAGEAAAKSTTEKEAAMETGSQPEKPAMAPTPPSAPMDVDSSATPMKSPANPDTTSTQNVHYPTIPLPATEDWMFVIEDGGNAVAPTVAPPTIPNLATSADATTPPGPAAAAVNQTPIPTDPQVLTALRMMEAMGFSNEGGWLTHLLETKRGDIGQVLDAIKPNRNANGGHYMA